MIKKLLFFTLLSGNLFCLSTSSLVQLGNDVSEYQLAMNQKGNAILAWSEATALDQDLLYVSTKDENFWTEPKKITESKDIFPIRCLIRDLGQSYVSWRDHSKNYLSKKENSSNTWSSPQKISKHDKDKFFIDGEDHLVLSKQSSLVFFDFDQKSLDFHQDFDYYTPKISGKFMIFQPNKGSLCLSEISNEKISMPEEIPNTKGYELYVNSLTHHGESLAFIYTEDDPISKDFLYRVFAKLDGSWISPHLITPKEIRPQDIAEPKIAIDSQKNLLVLYRIQKGRYTEIQAIYKPFQKPWSEPKIISNSNKKAFHPKIATDDQNHFVMVWEEHARRTKEIWASTFVFDTEIFTPPSLLSAKNKLCTQPKLAFNEPGRGIVTWIATLSDFKQVLEVAELRTKN